MLPSGMRWGIKRIFPAFHQQIRYHRAMTTSGQADRQVTAMRRGSSVDPEAPSQQKCGAHTVPGA